MGAVQQALPVVSINVALEYQQLGVIQTSGGISLVVVLPLCIRLLRTSWCYTQADNVAPD